MRTHSDSYRLEQLKAYLAGAGLRATGTVYPVDVIPAGCGPLNMALPVATLVPQAVFSAATPSLLDLLPPAAPLSSALHDSTMTADAIPVPTFEMFFNLDDDMDGEHDGDFLPTSSPKHDSSGESDIEKQSPLASRKRKSRRGKRRAKMNEDEEDDDFVDPEEEDENLFLPIEDVPIPEDVKKDAMKSLGVDNQAQLVNLINKMVNAGQEGMTPETVDKLKVLLTLVGPQGGWSG